MGKKEMRIEFWRSMFAGLVMIFVVVGILSLIWGGIHHDHSNQTMIQAVYLSELSGYENDLEPSDSKLRIAKQLALETRIIPSNHLNPELLLVTCYQGAMDRTPGSYIVQLHKSHPEAINQTLEGSTEPAEKLCALYKATVGLRWLPHGTTLLSIFCLGLLVVIIVCSEGMISQAWQYKESLLKCREEQALTQKDESGEDESEDESDTDEPDS